MASVLMLTAGQGSVEGQTLPPPIQAMPCLDFGKEWYGNPSLTHISESRAHFFVMVKNNYQAHLGSNNDLRIFLQGNQVLGTSIIVFARF